MVHGLPLRADAAVGSFFAVAPIILFHHPISPIVRPLLNPTCSGTGVHFSSVFWTILRSEVLLAWARILFSASPRDLFIVFQASCRPTASLRIRTTPSTLPAPPPGRHAAGSPPAAAPSWPPFASAPPLWEPLLLALHTSLPHDGPWSSAAPSLLRLPSPFYRFPLRWAFAALVVVTVGVASAHYLTGGIHPLRPPPTGSRRGQGPPVGP